MSTSFSTSTPESPKGMSRGKKIAIGVGILVVVGGIVGGSIAAKGKKGSPVAMAKVAREDVFSRVNATGQTEAKRKVDISANVMGPIVNLAVREGDRVKKGQFLLQIDRAQLKAQESSSVAALAALFADREAARANAKQAGYDAARAEKNFREKIVPEAEFQRYASARDSAKANLAAVERRIEQARAGLDASRDSLSKTTIRSPIDGIVTALPVEEGEIAVIGTMNNAGTKLMTISDMGEVEADMKVDETDVPRVAIGQKAQVTIDAFQGKTFTGTVSEIGSSPITSSLGSSTQGAVEFSVKIALDAPPADIRSGFSVNAEIETGSRKQVVAIPVQALVIQDMADKIAGDEKKAAEKTASTEVRKTGAGAPKKEVEGVFRVEAGKAKFVPVKTGLQGELNVEITEGLKEGDQIITGPFRILRTLKDGDPIRPEDDKKKKDGKKDEKKG
jgi:HlyD family secretion protein